MVKMRVGGILAAGLVALGFAWVPVQAHDGPHCPPLGLLLDFAAAGRLGDAEMACLPDDGPGGEGAFARWRNGWARGERSAGGLDSLVSSGLSADHALDVVEVVATDFPDLAQRTLAVARSGSSAWVNPVHRARQIDRVLALEAQWSPGPATLRWAEGLMALGVTGARLATARGACTTLDFGEACEKPAVPVGFLPPGEDSDAVPVHPSAMFAHAVFGRPYATERDLAASKVPSITDPAAAASVARVAMVLALDHADLGAAAIIARTVGPALSKDAAFVRCAARLHREVGDDPGARAWEALNR